MPTLETIEQTVESIVAKYSARNLRMMLICAFGCGVWATTQQLQLKSALDTVAEQRSMIGDLTKWKSDVSAKMDRNGWMIDSHESRITYLEKRP